MCQRTAQTECMRLNCVDKVMQLHIEEVAVSFEGRGADGCDTLIYNCEADKWGSPSSVDETVDDARSRHYECKERIEEKYCGQSVEVSHSRCIFFIND